MTRTETLFVESFRENASQTHRLMRRLIVAQALFVIAVAVWLLPRTWIGTTPHTGVHIVGSVILALSFAVVAMYLALRRTDTAASRIGMGAIQLLFSGLIIHVTGGRIESHFHIFASLAILSFYRDWRVIVVATAVTGVDHIVRGVVTPRSIYGLADHVHWRSLEHIAWVLFADAFILLGIRNQIRRMREIAETKARAEALQERTTQLLNLSLIHI